MQNPFAIPGRSESDGRPLCPWSQAEHEHLYAPVDHTEVAFQDFRRVLADDGDLTGAGKLVLITGHEGCGKSALMHRAAWWAKGSLGAAPGDVHIIDLMSEREPGEASGIRVERVMRRMLDEVRQLTLLSADELSGLDVREDDLHRVLPFLSTALARLGVTLLVLLPPVEVPADLRSYAGLVRSRLFFFLESSYLSEPEPSITVNGKAVIHLRVGILDEADGWAFVHDRLARAHSAGVPIPAIDPGTITRFMRDRIRGRGKTTIRELQRTCESVFSAAIKAQSTQVEYRDFTQYYVEKATLS